ncbi:thiolase family protein [Elongatibacter sediminis]|uniref:Thiolase family protein n=1 Tax=Elongatibacter sediminis TaxID=3119006 RepID=A0AAW9RGQ1_9GAMM
MSGLHQTAIVGVGTSEQRKRLERTALSACLDAALSAIRDAGMDVSDIDGVAGRWPGPGGTVMHPGSLDWATLLGIPVRWVQDTYPQGVPAVLDAAAAIAAGLCSSVLIVGGQAAIRDATAKVAAYTRPENEFIAPWGAFTAVHFALLAQQYLHRHPRSREGAAEAAAIIRNRGHANPEAVMYGRGPYTAEDILSANMIASPFTLLDLCLATEGAAAMVVTRRDIARDTRSPVWVLGGGCDWHKQQYVDPPRYEEVWSIGSDAAERAYRMADLKPKDIDLAQLYDINSFEVLRQLEVLGFCPPGEAADFVCQGGIGPEGDLSINTDGGLMSYSHIGWGGPTLKIVEAVHQLRHEAGDRQVADAQVGLATGAGSGAQYHNVVILGREPH